MKINSIECNEALRNYKTSTKSEELMIELLLIPEEDDDAFAKMTEKICTTLDTEEIEVLDKLVTKIRKELGIED